MNRTYAIDCRQKIGKNVILFGWINTIRDHGKVIFYDLRDSSAIIQAVAKSDFKVGSEDVVKIEGIVKARPKNIINPNIPTGEIEVEIQSLEIISKSQTLPFPIDTDGLDIEEALRLKYRYLDLRRERLVKNLKLRHQIISTMRQFF